MTIQMTVIGLNQIGASFGLALAAHKDRILRVGIDREPTVSARAEKLGAFDKIAFNLGEAVKNADMVILAVPVDEIEETLRAIAPDLKESAVVFDTSPLRRKVAEWAAEILPADRHYLTLMPTLNPKYLDESEWGVDAAHEDLFRDSLMVICSPVHTDPDALQLAADLTTLLGSKPYFSDMDEIDGLSAATELLPKLAASALLLATVDQPGWQEGRKLAGKAYAQGTSTVMSWDEQRQLGLAAVLNSENLLRVIDNLIAALQELRSAIAAGDEKALHGLLYRARDKRMLWLKQRQTSDWEIHSMVESPKIGDVLGRLIGLKPRKKPGL